MRDEKEGGEQTNEVDFKANSLQLNKDIRNVAVLG